MSSEDQEMMARISQLAGHINRHKNQQATQGLPAPYQHARGGSAWRRGRGAERGAPYPTRGYRGGANIHRHRSLVLNNSKQQGPDDDATPSQDAPNNPSWVTKNDRHLQLINATIYEKDAQARARAIEQTRQQKLAQKDDLERSKLIKHIHRTAGGGGASANPQAPGTYEISVQGIRFLVVKNGSKLVKAPGDNNSIKATPKMTVIGGVKFYRSKNGNLYRHGIVKAQRRSGVVKKVNVPCRMFSTTGSCPQGPRCRYQHDPARVGVCKDFLQKGECASGEACDLSHELTPQRTPACLHFAKDNCTNPSCRYAHVKVAASAPVCRPFGLYGFCERGAQCPERHAFECPDFSNTGVCRTKGCKLLHRERASVLRKAAAASQNDGDSVMEDVSSDEDGESVDSRDVDSDEVEEFIGQDDEVDWAERDFIQL